MYFKKQMVMLSGEPIGRPQIISNFPFVFSMIIGPWKDY